MDSTTHRISVMEQQLQVMQGEINAVLGEISTAMRGLAQGNKLALEVLAEKIRLLEMHTGINNLRGDTVGKEL